jgi:hypothetical protein
MVGPGFSRWPRWWHFDLDSARYRCRTNRLGFAQASYRHESHRLADAVLPVNDFGLLMKASHRRRRHRPRVPAQFAIGGGMLM